MNALQRIMLQMPVNGQLVIKESFTSNEVFVSIEASYTTFSTSSNISIESDESFVKGVTDLILDFNRMVPLYYKSVVS